MTSSYPTTLAKLIRKEGLTNTELGRRSNVHPNRVGAIANGRVVPPSSSVELKRLAAGLQYQGDPADLLEPVDEPAEAATT